MLFGIDVIGLIINAVPILPRTVILGLPPAAADIGTWGGCIQAYGLTALQCQGL
ncbi:hypothetical protein [Smaragdicoccus niigatensis]|uniref:hypothetical protein n=1 Tax=Smaragdicoccus niigatensis TaxID=359359 RepID=UPI00035F4C52|nr:hypothetical protein [Smaragdicoccus niigatensis]